MKGLDLIGKSELITLPSLDGQNIPARIDTGARTSTIWASGIREENNVLTFILFDEKSEFYTGKRFNFDNYSTRKVTNSTGHEENRYIIKIPAILKGRRIKATFTLADRSKQTYPILIGRNILSGKFVVDVKHGINKKDQ